MNKPQLTVQTDIERSLSEVESKCGSDTANLLRAELARLRQCIELDSDDDVLDLSPPVIRYLATPAIRTPDEMGHTKGNE